MLSNFGEPIYPDIAILYSSGENLEVPAKIRKDELTFALKDIESDFSNIMAKLFRKEELLRPVHSLCYALMNSSSIYPDHLFLTMTRALESYHRLTLQGQFVSDDEYQPIRSGIEAAITNGLDEIFDDSLRNKVKYGNEYSLRKRLRELLDRFSRPCSLFISDTKEFANSVVCTRNYLTHFDSEDRLCAKTGIELYWLGRKLQALLDICLMSELGLGVDKIESLVSPSQKYQVLRDK